MKIGKRLGSRPLGWATAGVIVVVVCGVLVVGFWAGLRQASNDPEGTRASASDNRATVEQVRATKDSYGIRFIKPTLSGGTYWMSNWEPRRDFTGIDPRDPWFDADHGSGSYEAGNGILHISGDVPRMYIYDPARQRQWRDVEITMYFRREADTDVPYAGMTAVARANHLATEDETEKLCDTRGYGARVRFDGNVDFTKETAHPESSTVATAVHWAEGMPQGTWIGYKFLVYDTAAGVKLELWLDKTGGKDGGNWRKVNEITDDGRLFGDDACAAGIDPKLALTNSPKRPGSESGKPNLSVYFRSDGIDEDGLDYKWGSIREIRS